ncbi:MAG: hypothetical protein ACRCWJ_15165 [Casimicrobium sp.]
MSPISKLWSAIVAAKTTIVVGLVVFGLTLPLGYCKGRSDANAMHEAARALANVKALQIDAEAGNQASEERVTDALAVNEQEKELLYAIAEIPDETPSAVRVRAGCERLRQQGTPEPDIPVVCGP